MSRIDLESLMRLGVWSSISYYGFGTSSISGIFDSSNLMENGCYYRFDHDLWNGDTLVKEIGATYESTLFNGTLWTMDDFMTMVKLLAKHIPEERWRMMRPVTWDGKRVPSFEKAKSILIANSLDYSVESLSGSLDAEYQKLIESVRSIDPIFTPES